MQGVPTTHPLTAELWLQQGLSGEYGQPIDLWLCLTAATAYMGGWIVA